MIYDDIWWYIMIIRWSSWVCFGTIWITLGALWNHVGVILPSHPRSCRLWAGVRYCCLLFCSCAKYCVRASNLAAPSPFGLGGKTGFTTPLVFPPMSKRKLVIKPSKIEPQKMLSTSINIYVSSWIRLYYQILLKFLIWWVVDIFNFCICQFLLICGSAAWGVSH